MLNYSALQHIFAEVTKVVKQIKVSDEVYMKLSQLKQELDESTFGGVVSQLMKVYEGLKTYRNLKQLLQLLGEIHDRLVMIDQLLSTTLTSIRSYGKEQKSAQKADLSSFMKK
jgi:predicted CopG family antitoxin